MGRLLFFLCTCILNFLGSVCGISYKAISVYFNLYLQGGLLMLSALGVWGCSLAGYLHHPDTTHTCLLAGASLYALAYAVAFVAMLVHYRLPVERAFDLCVEDLYRLAAACHTTYIVVNIVIFIVLFLILLLANCGAMVALCH